ncbi:MAG: galactokinase [Acidimicrobiia bacterium]|nr:galactokinase [Acidimicrobiia bacterium]
MSPEQRAVEAFRDRFGTDPALVVQAPGRVNLIGEHTDYNDGFVLPIAIDRRTVIAARPRTDTTIVVASENFPDARFDLPTMTRGGGWEEYIKGVAWAMNGDALPGWDGVIVSTIPIGASLSSSAALEIATALVFSTLAQRRWDPVAAAQSARRGESDWVGVSSGIMDQLISACGRTGHALLIDCRDLTRTPIPLPDGTRVAVLDTGTRRRLTESSYNTRRHECKEAAAAFGVASLRDLTAAAVADAPPGLSATIAKRAVHVVEENERTIAAARAMVSGGAAELGDLMYESHVSLRDNYEVSSFALDAMVEAAMASPGCLGARMTGAGFGGCAVALIDRAYVGEFSSAVADRYQAATRQESRVYLCDAAGGASVVADTPTDPGVRADD